MGPKTLRYIIRRVIGYPETLVDLDAVSTWQIPQPGQGVGEHGAVREGEAKRSLRFNGELVQCWHKSTLRFRDGEEVSDWARSPALDDLSGDSGLAHAGPSQTEVVLGTCG